MGMCQQHGATCGVSSEGSQTQGWQGKGPGQAGPGWMCHLGQDLSLWRGHGTRALQSPSADKGDSSPKHFVEHSPRAARGHPSWREMDTWRGSVPCFPRGMARILSHPAGTELDTEPLNPKALVLWSVQSASHRVPSLLPPPQSPESSHVTSRLGHCVSGDRGHSSEPA